jgi:hypothetical protein
MSSTDAEPTERTKSGSDSGFLNSIAFVTGQDANLGSFLLVVGIVTCVFIALFQFTLPTPISYLLTAGVLFVTVLSAIFASILDSLGYFETAADDADAASTPDSAGESASPARAWVPTGKAVAPLPPMINFDDELGTYAEMYDGDLPNQFDSFIEDYRRLKTNTGNRRTIASDLRADLNPIGALFREGTEGYDLYERIGERLFRYIDADAEHVTLNRVVFYDSEDNEVDVEGVRNRPGRVEFTVVNEGEAVDVDVIVQFYDAGGASVSSRTCRLGTVLSGASRTADTDVFVPSETTRTGTTIRTSTPRSPGPTRTPPRSGPQHRRRSTP